ncbi:AraC family transcriptional regulator [Kiloniella laminariae]|uniref:AraC family transcriptional regulator n=1 Tax=Kiloniella laminariae TaxID=454162 RepID=A0ABT4LIG0_9PROT|nr:AraC family transcriptional regulator [Kiloniella laminariae]MCZ4280897.1 AraC family transcriptional regulator [Kiloniella laminariae]
MGTLWSSLSGEPLASHRLFQTDELETARGFVASKFCGHRLDRVTATDHFDACYNHVSGHTLSLNYLRYGATVEIEPGELGAFYLIQLPIKGQAEVSNGAETVWTQQETGSVLNPTRYTKMRWFTGCEKILVRIDRRSLHDAAEKMLGQSINVPLVFQSTISFDQPKTMAWIKKLVTCVQAAEQGYLFGKSQSLGQMLVEEELLTDFLSSQPSNISHFWNDIRHEAIPRYLRRAQDYIHDNLSDGITVADISAAAGVSGRCLQLAFQHNFGCSPLQYLRRLRLNLAHCELMKTEKGTSVSEIAYGLGFTHLGRFAIAYRETFGQSPSVTRDQATAHQNCRVSRK